MSKLRRENHKYWLVPLEKQYKNGMKDIRTSRKPAYFSGKDRKRTRLIMSSVRELYRKG